MAEQFFSLKNCSASTQAEHRPFLLNISSLLQWRRCHESKTTSLVGPWWSSRVVVCWFRVCYLPLWVDSNGVREEILLGLGAIAHGTVGARCRRVGVPAC